MSPPPITTTTTIANTEQQEDQNHQQQQQEDLFPSALNLEDQFFQEGYSLGVADGSRAGLIEGRIFGLEKGFEKALEMGRVFGKGCVWDARSKLPSDDEKSGEEEKGEGIGGGAGGGVVRLDGNERLRKHIQRLVTLSDPQGLSLENGEEEVSEFDDRLRDARAKEVIVERILGEGQFFDGGGAGEEEVGNGAAAATGSMTQQQQQQQQQKKVPVRIRRAAGEKVGVAGKATGEMEDFVGRRGLGGI